MDDISIAEWRVTGATEERPLIVMRTLGAFSLKVGGIPLDFPRKTPRKPLGLLKALVALGRPAVCEHRLADALWPDAEADAAHQAFTMALYRLRKLLGSREAVALHDGWAHLDPRLCWVDAWAFERLSGVVTAGYPDEPTRALRHALALYRGEFLLDDEAPWAIATRERLRERFVRLVVRLAEQLEATGQWQEALDVLHQAIGVDDRTEIFYQGAMRAALHLNRKAEGITVFRHLQSVLPAACGASPSADSDQLLRLLLA